MSEDEGKGILPAARRLVRACTLLIGATNTSPEGREEDAEDEEADADIEWGMDNDDDDDEEEEGPPCGALIVLMHGACVLWPTAEETKVTEETSHTRISPSEEEETRTVPKSSQAMERSREGTKHTSCVWVA